MGHYDLYGNSYRTRREALNAEEAQCAAIDARLAYEKCQQLEEELHAKEQEQAYYNDPENRIHWLEEQVSAIAARFEYMEERIKQLESLTTNQ